ncbi:uncharacterized protein Ecym_6479 [Eremothecium cymbalariae DBVPG|uniref:Uncharacterized protein n=2 Tax=Eremothecium cymbalariae TaxID=45285 RepID=G8JUR9_ERECY|nr:hypothetical protein Ecym_6479 [Eremothecium cymbalariae DBVPG\
MQQHSKDGNQNGESENKDHWIIKGFVWNPQCVIA